MLSKYHLLTSLILQPLFLINKVSMVQVKVQHISESRRSETGLSSSSIKSLDLCISESRRSETVMLLTSLNIMVQHISESRRSETTVHTVEPHMQVLYMSESRMPETIMHASKLTNTTENRRLGWHPSIILFSKYIIPH